MKPAPAFATEAALCAEFLDAVARGGDWIAYAETAGWDILLVRRADGFQIGIQAKLRLNGDVLSQAVERAGYAVTAPGPDCRAVLVPQGKLGSLYSVAQALGVTVLRMEPPTGTSRRPWFIPKLPTPGETIYSHGDWNERAPARRIALPDYVPDVAAGAAAPLQLTDWKIKAIRIAVTLERRGFVTRYDFRHHGLDHRRWMAPAPGWLRPDNGRWIAGPALPDFKAQHPRVYAEILAEAEKWLPEVPLDLVDRIAR